MNIKAKCAECGAVFKLSDGLKEWQFILESGERCKATDIVCPECGAVETVQADNDYTLKLLRRQMEYLARRTKKSAKKACKIEKMLCYSRSKLMERLKLLSFSAADTKEPQKKFIINAEREEC